jgi:hypothetical protein
MRQTLWKDVADLDARIDGLLTVLSKGYPEYNPDQSRGEDGRWSGGSVGGISEGRAKPGERAKLASEYERKFGRKPPSRVNADWLRAKLDWMDSMESSSSERNRRPEWSKSMGAKYDGVKGGLDRIKRDVDGLTSKSEAERQAASDRMSREAQKTWDTMRSYDGKVWYEPSFADHVLQELTSTHALLIAGLGGLATGGVVMTVYGAAVTATALYLMARWVYRKAATGGRYAGVRPGWNTGMD